MWSAAWLGAAALLPGVVLALAWIWRGRPWHPRWPAADCFRIITGVMFAGWVHPALGVLAAQGGWWWLKAGWMRVRGGLQWPWIATMLFLATQAPPWAITLGVTLALVMGIVQVAFAVAQSFNQFVFFMPAVSKNHPTGFLGRFIHGTIGHRTGLGIYLATLIPLSFLVANPWAWLLAGCYAVGVALSTSSLASLAAVVGFLWVQPTFWPVALVMFSLGFIGRMVKWHPIHRRLGIRSMDHVWIGRIPIWKQTLRRAKLAWLWGHGAGSFDLHGRTWNREAGLREVYREAHNDYLEFYYEHGVVGALAIGWLVMAFWPGVAWQDPATGCLIAFAVAMLANFPCRVVTLAALPILALTMILQRVAL